MILQAVVEGDTDVPIVRKLAADAGFDVADVIDCSGKARIDRDLEGFNGSAKGSPWFVLRNLGPRRRLCARARGSMAVLAEPVDVPSSRGPRARIVDPCRRRSLF